MSISNQIHGSITERGGAVSTIEVHIQDEKE